MRRCLRASACHPSHPSPGKDLGIHEDLFMDADDACDALSFPAESIRRKHTSASAAEVSTSMFGSFWPCLGQRLARRKTL